MEIERLLRETLDLERLDGEPSPGLGERVMRALPDRRERRRTAYVAVLLAAAAVMALVAVLVPWYVGSPSAVQGGPSASSRDSAIVAPGSAATAVPLAHARKWGFSFDYPAAWQVSDAPALPAVSSPSPPPDVSLESLYQHQVLGYVGTQTPRTDCKGAAVAPLPSADWAYFLGSCTSTWSLRPGDVSIRFQRGYAFGVPLVAGQPVEGTIVTTVGGIAALLEVTDGSSVPLTPNGPGFGGGDPTFESAAAADEILTWYLPGNEAQPIKPNDPLPGYRITAVIRGPDNPALAEVQEVIASIEYDPAVIPLPADSAERAALAKTSLAAALGSLNQSNPGSFSCFPRTAGTATATITVTPMTVKLGKPLPVSCTSAIKPNLMQGWTITLTVGWSAAADRKAGTWTEEEYTTSDGRVWGNVVWTPNDTFPYEAGSGKSG
jgi:hypothetical protein